MIIFAHSAKHHGIKMYILNDAFYGWIPQPLEPPHNLKDEKDQLSHIRTEHAGGFQVQAASLLKIFPGGFLLTNDPIFNFCSLVGRKNASNWLLVEHVGEGRTQFIGVRPDLHDQFRKTT